MSDHLSRCSALGAAMAGKFTLKCRVLRQLRQSARQPRSHGMHRTFVGLSLLVAAPALAHDFWSNGERVDPVTKQLCCSESEHFQLSAAQVETLPDGFRVTGEFETGEGHVSLNELVPSARTMPSPDGRYHVNIIDGRVQCFFAPLTN